MFVCVVFVVLLVASVLASMRRLLCGDDGSKKTKTRSVITEKNPAMEFISIIVLINSNFCEPLRADGRCKTVLQ